MNTRQEEKLKQARQVWSQGDHAAAYSIYETLLREYSQAPVILREYGRALVAEFECFAQATDLFEQALSLEPDSIITLLYLGNLYDYGYGAGYSASVPLYQRVIALASDDPNIATEAYTRIGIAHNSPGHPVSVQDALAAYRKAMELEPDCINAQEDLATLLYEVGDFAASYQEFKVAEQRAKKLSSSVNYIQKMLTCLESHERATTWKYSYKSIIPEWPEGEIV